LVLLKVHWVSEVAITVTTCKGIAEAHTLCVLGLLAILHLSVKMEKGSYVFLAWKILKVFLQAGFPCVIWYFRVCPYALLKASWDHISHPT
jgi:hypothetical protein